MVAFVPLSRRGSPPEKMMSISINFCDRDIYRKLIKFYRAKDRRDWKVINDLTAQDVMSYMDLGEVSAQ